MSLLPTFRPRIRMLSDEFVARIIDEAFDVMEKTGLMFENARALDILAEHGQRVDRQAERAYLSRSLVEKANRQRPEEPDDVECQRQRLDGHRRG